jgi:hypothetical protein
MIWLYRDSFTPTGSKPAGKLESYFRRYFFMQMDNVTFGVTMLVCGMGGTLLTLWIMSLVMGLMGKIFPYKKEED